MVVFILQLAENLKQVEQRTATVYDDRLKEEVNPSTDCIKPSSVDTNLSKDGPVLLIKFYKTVVDCNNPSIN